MPVRTSVWPLEALPFEEILTPVVESFLDAEERGAFDFSRSAIQQLYDRVDALGALPREDLLIDLIRDRLGEFDCLAICNSGFREPRSLRGTTLASRWVRNCFAIDTPSSILLKQVRFVLQEVKL